MTYIGPEIPGPGHGLPQTEPTPSDDLDFIPDHTQLPTIGGFALELVRDYTKSDMSTPGKLADLKRRVADGQLPEMQEGLVIETLRLEVD